MTLQILKATKTKSLLRGAIFGPAGSGKTLTSLLIARGFIENMPGKRIGVIDTERRAEKYSGQLDHLKRNIDFDIVDIADAPTIANYIDAINLFVATGEHGFLIIDSSTHAWESLKDDVSKIAKARYKGNEWAAWSEGTPMQREFIEKLTLCPLHIIWTMRSATEWKTSDSNGKSQPIRVGLKPEQGKNIEYEADFLLEMTTDHICTVLKDTSGKFQDQIITLPDEKFGRAMFDWLNTGADAPPRTHMEKVVTAGQFTARAEGQLTACKSLEELQKAWLSMQEELKKESDVVRMAVTATKDRVKASLAKPAPAAEPKSAPAAAPAPAEPVPETLHNVKPSDVLFGPEGEPAKPEPAAPAAAFRPVVHEMLSTAKRVRSRSGLLTLLASSKSWMDSGEMSVAEYEAIATGISGRAKELNIELTEQVAA